MRTLIQILGWIEHCERDLNSHESTKIPAWLCSWEAFKEAVDDGYIEEAGKQPIVPRLNMYGSIFRLTDKGRKELYDALPRAEEKPRAVLPNRIEQERAP